MCVYVLCHLTYSLSFYYNFYNLTAGLKLFTKHSNQFGSCLMDHYVSIFDVMSKLCGHINGELKKSSYVALESFLKQVCSLFKMIQFSMFFISSNMLNLIMMTLTHQTLVFAKVATLVAENIELHKSKLKFFMQKFCAIIRTMVSSNKELSIAIRGYGLFAAVCIS